MYGLDVCPNVVSAVFTNSSLFINIVMNPLCFNIFPNVLDRKIILVNVPLGTALCRGECV
jgi:hypothetical protein